MNCDRIILRERKKRKNINKSFVKEYFIIFIVMSYEYYLFLILESFFFNRFDFVYVVEILLRIVFFKLLIFICFFYFKYLYLNMF